jgi:hypothetical protein
MYSGPRLYPQLKESHHNHLDYVGDSMDKRDRYRNPSSLEEMTKVRREQKRETLQHKKTILSLSRVA